MFRSSVFSQLLRSPQTAERLAILPIRMLATKSDGGGRAKKTKKDENGPKRPLSSYMHFAIKERPVVVKERPELKFPEVGKELGERWKHLSDDKKKVFEDAAAKDKLRYEKEVAAFKKTKE